MEPAFRRLYLYTGNVSFYPILAESRRRLKIQIWRRRSNPTDTAQSKKTKANQHENLAPARGDL